MNEASLRKIVGEALQVLDGPEPSDEESRDACTDILEAIERFSSNDSLSNFPFIYLGEILPRVLREIGPGDTLFRSRWFAVLKNARSPDALKFALEFAPCTLLKQHEEQSIQLIHILRSVTESYYQVALPDVFMCIRRLVDSRKLTKKAAFQFFVNHCGRSSRENAVIAMECLMDHADDEADWALAVEAVRRGVWKCDKSNEQSCESHELLETMLSATIRFQQEGLYKQFFGAYLKAIHDFVSQPRPVAIMRLLSVGLADIDVAILLLHRDTVEHETTVEQIFDHAIYNNMLAAQTLASLARLVRADLAGDTLPCHPIVSIQQHMVWLLVFICVAPLKSPKIPDSEVSCASLAMEYGGALVQSKQADVCQSVSFALLQLNDQCLDIFNKKDHSSYDENDERGRINEVQKVQLNLVGVLWGCMDELASILRSQGLSFERSFDAKFVPPESVRQMCQILINIETSDTPIESETFPATFLLMRSLLFGFDLVNGAGNASIEERRIRGLIFLTEMVKSRKYTSKRLFLLWQLLRQMMIPPADRLMEPRVGIFGLEAIRAFHEWSQDTDNAEAQTSLQPGVFPSITSVLQTPRLVGYARTLPENRLAKVGYSYRPEVLRVPEARKRSYHKMFFSFDALLNDHLPFTPESWDLYTRWVHDLINTYLVVGRTKSKCNWIPHAWTEATFEFPSADMSILRAVTGKQQRIVQYIGETLQQFDGSGGSVVSRVSMDRDFGEALKQVKKRSDRSKLVRNLLQSSTSFCFALALSAGILDNTNAHFSHLLNAQDIQWTQSRTEAIRMMQYQLFKIYDLAMKCRMMEGAFRGIFNANARKKRRHIKGRRGERQSTSIFDNKKFDAAVQQAMETLNPIVALFTETNAYVKTSVLWHCLVDPSHDTILIKNIELYSTMIQDDQHMEIDMDAFDVIVDLRLNILRHLTAHFNSFSKQNHKAKRRQIPDDLRRELDAIQPYFAQCLRLASYFSIKLASKMHVEDGRLSKVSRLTGCYFRLLLQSMEIMLGSSRDGAVEEGFGKYWSLYQSILGSDSPLTDAVCTIEAKDVTFIPIMNSVIKHLSKCRSLSIATELLETLTVFALYCNTQESIQKMVTISWTAMHSPFSLNDGGEVNTGMPWSLVEALDRLSPGSLVQNSKLRTSKNTAIRETILKSALGRSKNHEKYWFQVQSMIRQWGFLALAEDFGPICADHLHEMYMSLSSFLNTVKKESFPKPRVHKDLGSSDDEEYVPPKSRFSGPPALPLNSAVRGLDIKNHYAYFQILLDMTVASTALFKVKEGAEWVDPLNGPYRELCKVIETFGSLIALYQRRIYAFPQQVLPGILNACRSMLNVVSFQCRECIDWRSSQPALSAEQLEAETFDSAAVHFLGRVFDVFGIHVIGTLDSLCGFIETAGGLATDGTNTTSFTVAQRQKGKALKAKINKISSELEKHALSHRLALPRTVLEEEEQAEQQPIRKRRRIEIKGFLQFYESAEESEDTNQMAGLSGANATANFTPSEQQAANNEVYSSELTWDAGSSSSDEGSFGVDGDWGRESEEEPT